MNVQKVDFKAANAAQLFTQSLHETGFAVLVDHPVQTQAIEKLYQAWQKFFLSPEPDKQKFLVDRKTQMGYVPPSISEVAKGYDVRDLKEFYNYYPWGDCPAELKPLTQQLFDELKAVGKILLRWLDDNSPDHVKVKFPMPLENIAHESQRILFRVNYFPPLSGQEQQGAFRAAAHEDIDFLTVLTGGTQSGLQVKDLKGQWHDVPCDPGNLVINAGDMLQESSGGYYPSTTHRVLNPTGEATRLPRMSCPMFIQPNDDVVLSERYTAGSYLHERLTEIGLIKEEAKENA